MVKQTAPIQEVSRLLDLVPYLSTHSHISLKELAQEFGITEKEMGNELTALSMCGLPGYTPYELIEVFFDSGFVSINNHEALDIPRALTNLEVATLLIGLSLLRDSVSSNGEATQRIDQLTEELSSLLGQTIAIQEHPQSTLIGEINRAIANRAELDIDYADSVKQEVNSRRIVPLSLYSENSHTYLSAYCNRANGYRNFRIDRISRLDICQSQSEKVPTQVIGEFELFTATLKVAKRRRAIAELLSLGELPAKGEFAFSSFSPAWLEKAAISFAPDLVVTTPLETRSAIRGELENTLALYRP
jgi:proteasome accessory factor C